MRLNGGKDNSDVVVWYSGVVVRYGGVV